MGRIAAALIALLVAGCSGQSLSAEEEQADLQVPPVCLPNHERLPCNDGVDQGVEYRFNLQTHCGIEWAYFDGRYWVPKPKVDTPPQWASIEGGTIILEAPSVAVFEADEGGDVRFEPAPSSYRPPGCV